MSIHEKQLTDLVKVKATLAKVGNAVPAKDLAELTTAIDAMAADMKKAIPLGVQQKKSNEHLAVFFKAIATAQQKFDAEAAKAPDSKPVLKLVQKINGDAETYSGKAEALGKDLKKKKDDKNAKILADAAQEFWNVFRMYGSYIVWVGDADM